MFLPRPEVLFFGLFITQTLLLDSPALRQYGENLL